MLAYSASILFYGNHIERTHCIGCKRLGSLWTHLQEKSLIPTVRAKASVAYYMRILTTRQREEDSENDLEQLSFVKLPHEKLQPVEYYWSQLETQLTYHSTSDLRVIKSALQLAYQAHELQKRHSGDPFITHPVAVANILAELRMDRDTIVAGLLHDTVEDTEVTLSTIEQLFGMEVRRIVEGETKVSKLPKMADISIDKQAENLRQLFIAMTEDWRIIIVKLADRLHNMRTLQFMKQAKRHKIAKETLDIFAPLAHRLGMWQIKAELERLGFMYLYPSEYEEIRQLVEKKLPKYMRVLEESRQALKTALQNDVILQQSVAQVEVSARIKELYSLWKKMQQHGKDIEDIYDLVALRVLITPKPMQLECCSSDASQCNEWNRKMLETLEKSLCYYTLGIVHAMWQPFPCRVKDYIAFPKENGYQSLHTTVMAGGAQAPLEVQIRTLEMHLVAEYGMAAHWMYKDNSVVIASKATRWMSTIVEWGDEIANSREFVELVRRELLGSRVFVFAKFESYSDRCLEIFNLPRGSTIVDIAFQLDSCLGLRMTCARVHGKIVPFWYILENADVVTIACNSSAEPQIEWMDYAKTRIAKRNLRLYFDQMHTKQCIQTGFHIWNHYFDKYGISLESLKEKERHKMVYILTEFDDWKRYCIHLTSLPIDERHQELEDIRLGLETIGYPLLRLNPMKCTNVDFSKNSLSSFWLRVFGKDRNGLLSDVSAVVSRSISCIKQTNSVTQGTEAMLEYHVESTSKEIENIKCLLLEIIGVERVVVNDIHQME
ncbi:guanosine-3',5'-bis(diphosphate) 3'-pyrophosphohydrolase [Galdieria sulphuraria]|uniref:GTP diphosphokinase n=1 Tax=Galdieria sulphuraria TaxID=130081 RepID=M2XYR6_GALSU|nr:guanosine-3',5'-bis(diphosphate) 3'-pyrophosphohydrolase [Galdieria sulphuraria]EME28808.1 guanosine-3',5'-bis(diphosphate) 3'-pyrophosphohydrolase [Galdieria sulphuraria]|eukprot:XP_005705328.1 guanosine-3',5'-bis(diphosphate) 3'-pyrophosphohydrolase [Galdieria sulphuraria]